MRPWIVLLVLLFCIPSAAHADGLFVEAGGGFNYSRSSEAVFLRYYKDTSSVFGLRSFYDFSLASWSGPNNNQAVAIGRGVLWGWTEEFYSSFEAGGASLVRMVAMITGSSILAISLGEGQREGLSTSIFSLSVLVIR